MSLQSHLSELKRRHRAVDSEIDDLRCHPSVGDDRILELKRKKLHIKDEIVALEQGDQNLKAAA